MAVERTFHIQIADRGNRIAGIVGGFVGVVAVGWAGRRGFDKFSGTDQLRLEIIDDVTGHIFIEVGIGSDSLLDHSKILHTVGTVSAVFVGFKADEKD